MQNKRRSILFSLLSNELGNSQNEAPNNERPSQWLGGSQPPRPLLVLRRGTYPPPVPLPTSGGGSTAPYSVARTLRYPRPIKGSRGDSLRNKVAIVYAGSARHLAESLLKPPEQFYYMEPPPIFATKSQIFCFCVMPIRNECGNFGHFVFLMYFCRQYL